MRSREARLVARAVVVEGDRVLLALHQHDGSPAFWCFPGGHVEPGEGLAQAAAREVQEETGYLVEPTRVVYLQDFAQPPGPDVAEVFFAARRVGGQWRPGAEPGLRQVEWVPLAELRRRPVLPRPLAQAIADGTWQTWSVPVPPAQAKGRSSVGP